MAWFLVRPNHRQKQVIGELTIGRDPTCSIVLEGPSVSRLHCRLRAEGDRLVLENCSQFGTQLNGTPLERSVLEADDVIELPGHRFTVVQHRNTLPFAHDTAHDTGGRAEEVVAPRSPPSRRANLPAPSKTDASKKSARASASAPRRSASAPPSNGPLSTAEPMDFVLSVVEDEETVGERYCDAVAVGDEGSIILMLDIIEGPAEGSLADLTPQWRAMLRLVGMRAGAPDQLLEEIHRGMIQSGVKARGVCVRVDVPERVALVSAAGGVAPWVLREGDRLAPVRLPASVGIGTGRATRFAVRAVHFDRGDTLWISSEGWAADLEAALATPNSTREEILSALKAAPHARGGAVVCLARTK